MGPVIQAKELYLLDQIVTGGLTVTAEYHALIVQQITELAKTFDPRGDPSGATSHPSDRCRRLLQALADHPPGSPVRIYIG